MSRPPSADSGTVPVIVQLDPDACRALLARQRLCILSMADGEAPYAVPLFYGFDGATLHLGLSEGRKTALLEGNPRVCITVTELGEGDAWASVQVTGTAEWVDGNGRDESIRVLMEHNRRVRALTAAEGGEAPPATPRRHGTGRLVRIRDPRITGRARG